MTEAYKRRQKRYYLNRLAEHRCARCGKQDERTLEGRVRCEVCAEIERQRPRKQRTEEQREADNANKRDWLHRCLEAKVCVECRSQDARTLDGRYCCAQCAKRRNHRQRENWDCEKRSAQAKTRREKWREAGLCTMCGHPKEEPERALCIDCRVRARMNNKRRKLENGWHPRGAYGFCFQCNKAPAMEGRKLCAKCYGEKLEMLRRTAEKRKEKHAPSDDEITNGKDTKEIEIQ